MTLKIGIPKEIHPAERRVAATPQTIIRLKKLGFEVAVESGAGHGINCANGEYREAGAEIVDDVRRTVGGVRRDNKGASAGGEPGARCPRGRPSSRGRMAGRFYLARPEPRTARPSCKTQSDRLRNGFVPRITRAQKMDTLSAMANIAGYRAVIEAANNFPRFFAGQITAAGRIDPAKVLVIGAGVAGLSAIGAATGHWARSLRHSIRVRQQKTRSPAWAPSFSRSTSRRKAKARADMQRRCPTPF